MKKEWKKEREKDNKDTTQQQERAERQQMAWMVALDRVRWTGRKIKSRQQQQQQQLHIQSRFCCIPSIFFQLVKNS